MRKDGLRDEMFSGKVVSSGESICFTVLTAGPIGYCKLEASEEQSPTSLAWVKTFRTFDILQIFVISDDLERVSRSL